MRRAPSAERRTIEAEHRYKSARDRAHTHCRAHSRARVARRSARDRRRRRPCRAAAHVAHAEGRTRRDDQPAEAQAADRDGPAAGGADVRRAAHAHARRCHSHKPAVRATSEPMRRRPGVSLSVADGGCARARTIKAELTKHSAHHRTQTRRCPQYGRAAVSLRRACDRRCRRPRCATARLRHLQSGRRRSAIRAEAQPADGDCAAAAWHSVRRNRAHNRRCVGNVRPRAASCERRAANRQS